MGSAREKATAVAVTVGRRSALVLLVLVVAVAATRSAFSCRSRVAAGPSPALPPAAAPDAVSGEMVHVPAGEFSMGNSFGEADEKPVRTVELMAFEIDRTEVTV